MTATGEAGAPGAGGGRRLEELAFLEEVARLAASARTWDELMVTVVDRATAAAGAGSVATGAGGSERPQPASRAVTASQHVGRISDSLGMAVRT